MINQADLLQADATVIAGVLIFLTVAPMSRGAAEIIHRLWIMSLTFFMLSFFISSSILLLDYPFFPSPPTENEFKVAQFLFSAGLVLLLVTILAVTRTSLQRSRT
jgi:uncharacterized membrane protein YtjA (UPF0391 family)